MSKKIVVFTGAGFSAESGLGTFRDTEGIWEKFKIEEVCSEVVSPVTDYKQIRRHPLMPPNLFMCFCFAIYFLFFSNNKFIFSTLIIKFKFTCCHISFKWFPIIM